MPGPTLTADELAETLGRKPGWIYDHWSDLVARKRMPKPLHDAAPLIWDRAQIYAWLDRALPAADRAAAAAYRAALEAAHATLREHTGDAAVTAARRQMDEKYGQPKAQAP